MKILINQKEAYNPFLLINLSKNVSCISPPSLILTTISDITASQTYPQFQHA
jgi:hypothetical protein